MQHLTKCWWSPTTTKITSAQYSMVLVAWNFPFHWLQQYVATGSLEFLSLQSNCYMGQRPNISNQTLKPNQQKSMTEQEPTSAASESKTQNQNHLSSGMREKTSEWKSGISPHLTFQGKPQVNGAATKQIIFYTSFLVCISLLGSPKYTEGFSQQPDTVSAHCQLYCQHHLFYITTHTENRILSTAQTSINNSNLYKASSFTRENLFFLT